MFMNKIIRKQMTGEEKEWSRSLPGFPIGFLIIDSPQDLEQKKIYKLKKILIHFKKRVSFPIRKEKRVMKNPYVIHKEE